MKNILILYTSSGYGHKKIAENIASVLHQDHNVDLVNLFQVENGRMTRWGIAAYLWILQFIPGLWNFFYTNKTFIDLTLPFRVKIAAGKSARIARILKEGNYDTVITTQVDASSILSYLKSVGKYKGQFVVSFSDLHLHRFWLFDNVDLYLANIEEQKEEMVQLGIDPNKIVVAGITVPKPQILNSSEIRNKYGVLPERKVVLVLGGGRGLGMDGDTISELKNLPIEVFAVCGHNEVLKSQLEKYFSNYSNVRILGFVDNMQELYAISSVVLTKPGGLTVAECLQNYLPMIVVECLPGQERFNYEYLRDRNLVMQESLSVTGTVEDELKTGLFAAQLKSNPSVQKVVRYGEEIKSALGQ